MKTYPPDANRNSVARIALMNHLIALASWTVAVLCRFATSDLREKRQRTGAVQNLTAPSHAFSLIELLVVSAIIAILASLLLPVLGRSKTTAYNAVCVNNLRQLGIATRIYSDENQERLPSAEI